MAKEPPLENQKESAKAPEADGPKPDSRRAAARFPTQPIARMQLTVMPKAAGEYLGEDNVENMKNLSIYDLELDAGMGVPFNENRTVLLFGAAYGLLYTDNSRGHRYYSFHDPDATYVIRTAFEDLHAVRLNFGLFQNLKDRWNVVLMAIPGMYSNFNTFDLLSFNLQGTAMAVYHHSEDFQLSFGLTYGTQFGRMLVFPMVTVNWYIGHDFRLDTMLPVEFQIRYIPHDRVVIGLMAKMSGQVYRITSLVRTIRNDPTDLSDLSPETESVPTAADNRLVYILKHNRIHVGPEVRIRMVKGLYVFTEGGLVLRNQMEVEKLCTKDDGASTCLNSLGTIEFMNDAGGLGWLLSGGFEYRM